MTAGGRPLWRKAPLVLLRLPGIFAAVGGSVLLLSLAAASFPLFLSSTETGLVRAAIENPLVTRYGVGISFHTTDLPLSGTAPDGRPLREAQEDFITRWAAAEPHLGSVLSGTLGPTISLSPPGAPSRARPARLLARAAAFDHVDVVEGRRGDGVWISELTAQGLGIGPGDRISLRLGGDRARAPVDAVYRALHGRPSTGYWRAYYGHIYPRCLDCPVPPPFVLGSRELVDELLEGLGATSVSFGLEVPAATAELTLDQVRDLAGSVAALRADLSQRGTPSFEVFGCCGVREGPSRRTSELVSHAARTVAGVEERVVPIAAPVRLLAGAALLVALGVVGAAARFASRGRRTEMGFLFARGWRPASVAGKTLVEAMLPTAVGGIAGFGLAQLLVGAGGGGAVAATTLASTARLVGLVLVAGIALMGVVAGVTYSGLGGERRRRLRWAPYAGELALIATAAIAVWRIRVAGAVPGPEEIAAPNVFLLLLPLAVIGGLGSLGARALRSWFGRLRRATQRSSSFLAIHRLARSPALVVLLMTAAVVTLGVYTYGRITARSLEATVEAKAGVLVGGPAAARIEFGYSVPEGFPYPTTAITRRRAAGRLLPSGRRFDLVAVDPETLPTAAYWNERFAEADLSSLMDRISDPGTGPLPVLVSGVGGEVEGQGELTIGLQRIPVWVVGRTTVFPSQLSLPVVVADREGLVTRLGEAVLSRAPAITELVIDAPAAEARTSLAPLGIPPEDVLTTEDVERTPSVAATISTLAALDALAASTGLLVLALLVMYLQARQRSQIVSYALSARMGLTDASHRSAVVQELGVMTGFGLVAGVALSVLASLLVVPEMDPVPNIPPGPMFVFPLGTVLLIASGLAGVSVAAAWYITSRMRRADLAEVMRVGG